MPNEAAVTDVTQVAGDIIDWEDIVNKFGQVQVDRAFDDFDDGTAVAQAVQRAVRAAEAPVKAGAGKVHEAYVAALTPATAHELLKQLALRFFRLCAAERVNLWGFSGDMDEERRQLRLEVNDIATNKVVLDGVTPPAANSGGDVVPADETSTYLPDETFSCFGSF